MTVAENSRRREYPGNGVTTIFNGPSAYAPEEISAFLFEDGASTPVSPDAYSVRNFGRESGTRIEMQTPPAIGQTLILLRTVPYAQGVDITNQGAFLPETIEKGYDQIVFQTQQLADSGLRSLRFPDDYPVAGISVDMPFPQPGRPLVWDSSGTQIVNGSTELTGDLLLRGELASPESGAALVQYQPGVSVKQRLDELEDAAMVQTASISFACPGDFPTIQEAINVLSRRVFPQGTVIDLVIPSGATFPGRVYVTEGDYSMFRIKSEDSVVDVPASFTGDLIVGYRCRLPVLHTVVDMKGLGGVGYGVYRASIGNVADGCGVINAGTHGLESRGSVVYATLTVWHGAIETGIRAQAASSVNAEGANVSNSGHRGLYVSRGSVVHFMDANAQNCGHGIVESTGSGGIVARRSHVSAENANVSGSYNGIYATGASTISAAGLIANNCAADGARIAHGSRMDGGSATANNCVFRSFRAEFGASINLRNAQGSVTGSPSVVSTEVGSFVTVQGFMVGGSPISTSHVNVASFNALSAAGAIFN